MFTYILVQNFSLGFFVLAQELDDKVAEEASNKTILSNINPFYLLFSFSAFVFAVCFFLYWRENNQRIKEQLKRLFIKKRNEDFSSEEKKKGNRETQKIFGKW